MNREELLIEAEELGSKLGSPELRLYDATFVPVSYTHLTLPTNREV